MRPDRNRALACTAGAIPVPSRRKGPKPQNPLYDRMGDFGQRQLRVSYAGRVDNESIAQETLKLLNRLEQHREPDRAAPVHRFEFPPKSGEVRHGVFHIVGHCPICAAFRVGGGTPSEVICASPRERAGRRSASSGLRRAAQVR